MVYIQNIFLNQKQDKDELKFPYIPKECGFRNDFAKRYSELWDDILKSISEDPINDQQVFIKKKNLFYQVLFTEAEDTLNQFNEIYQSFRVWFGSLAGRFSLERSIDESSQTLYVELSNDLMKNEIEPLKELNISLIYDDCLLANTEATPYFIVLPIRDFIVNNKELSLKLRECF
nr:hypothetical protein [Pullulanibacillus pueri]